MIKVIKIYENIEDFNDLSERGDFIKAVYKDTDTGDAYFEHGAKMSMRPGTYIGEIKYNILALCIRFETLQHAIHKNYENAERDFSVRAWELERLEVIQIES